MLNRDVSYQPDPTLLEEPSHVMLNHFYAQVHKWRWWWSWSWWGGEGPIQKKYFYERWLVGGSPYSITFFCLSLVWRVLRWFLKILACDLGRDGWFLLELAAGILPSSSAIDHADIEHSSKEENMMKMVMQIMRIIGEKSQIPSKNTTFCEYGIFGSQAPTPTPHPAPRIPS